MSQISPPIRIVLAVALAFMAAWFVFLRPGAEPAVSTPTQSAAPGSGFGKAVSNAKDAAATGNAAAAPAGVPAATAPGTTAATGGTPAQQAPATAKPKGDGQPGLPASVAKAVEQKKTLVMLFWNRKGIDDRVVRHELTHIDRRKGAVKVHVAPIKDVARYASITRGVNLEQSPTIVVVKGDTADALVGYVDSGTINQSVSDVIRSSRGEASGAPADPYLSAIYNECVTADDQGDALFDNVKDRASLHAALDRALALSAAADARVKKLAAPKKYRAFKRDFDAVNAKGTALLRDALAKLKATSDPAEFRRIGRRLEADGKKLIAPLKKKYSKLGLGPCFDDE